MESFVDHMPAFVPLPGFRAQGQSDRVTSMSLADLFRVVLSPFERDEALQGEKARHFWHAIIQKGSALEDRPLPQSVVAQTSSTNQMLKHHLLNDAAQLQHSACSAWHLDWMASVFVWPSRAWASFSLVASNKKMLSFVRKACWDTSWPQQFRTWQIQVAWFLFHY